MVAKDPSTDSFALAKSALWTNCCLSVRVRILMEYHVAWSSLLLIWITSLSIRIISALQCISYRGYQLRLFISWTSDRGGHWCDLCCQGRHLLLKVTLEQENMTIVFTVEFSGFAATMVLISVTMVMISEQFAAAALVLEELARLSTC